MNNSKDKLLMILIPNIGNDVSNSGNKAQCIAQAIDAKIPRASQFIFLIILTMLRSYCFATLLQNKS